MRGKLDTRKCCESGVIQLRNTGSDGSFRGTTRLGEISVIARAAQQIEISCRQLVLRDEVVGVAPNSVLEKGKRGVGTLRPRNQDQREEKYPK